MSEVMAIGDRTNNADLMAGCATLGYLPDPVLDLTYGKGRFWNESRPLDLATNDADESTDATYHEDFTATGWVDDGFGAVVFDPPYKLNGTSKPRGPATSDVDYGVAGDYMPMRERHKLMRDGLAEAIRITRPGGFVLTKCQDQVSSGQVRWQTRMLEAVAKRHGCKLVDELHVRGYRQQPPGRSQKHARRDYSTLLVFKKGKKVNTDTMVEIHTVEFRDNPTAQQVQDALLTLWAEANKPSQFGIRIYTDDNSYSFTATPATRLGNMLSIGHTAIGSPYRYSISLAPTTPIYGSMQQVRNRLRAFALAAIDATGHPVADANELIGEDELDDLIDEFLGAG